MNKTLSIIIGILALAKVIYSFNGNSDSENIFGFEINIWIYRLFWSLIAISIFYDYYKKRKQK